MLFQWQPELSVGVPIVDAQHQEIVRRINHLDFLSQVLQLKLKLDRKGPTSALVIAVQHQVVGWLRSHIQQEDRKLAAFIQARTPALA